MNKLKQLIKKLKIKDNKIVKSLVNYLTKILASTTIVRQVQVGFLLLIIVSLLTGGIIWYNTNQISQRVNEIEDDVIPVVKLNSQISKESMIKQINIYRWYIDLMGTNTLKLFNDNGLLEKYVNELGEHIKDEEMKDKLDKIAALNSEFKAKTDELIISDKLENQRKMQLKTIDGQLMLGMNIANNDLNKMVWNKLDENIRKVIDYADGIKKRVIVIVMLSLFIGVILGVVISYGVSNLTAIIKKRTKDAASKVKTVTDTSQEMEAIADEVDNEITQAFAVIKDLISGNVEVATAVEKVTVSLQEVQGGVNKLSQQAKLISNAGKDTYQSIENTSQKIESGTRIVHKTADTMQELRRSADKIGKISDRIMQITDQTNLLALNAAIEAARAGEHGRGFAVVAEEIKALATESIEATKEVKGITQEIEGVVEAAVAVMSKSKDSSQESIIDIFDEINRLSNQVEEKMKAVMSSSENQVISSEQLSSVVEEISASSEEVSAQTEETLNSAEKIKDLMTEVTHAITNLYFKIKEGSEVSQEQLEAINQVVEANNRLKK
ncbi:hypothetical protein U472_14435 [Orenia metallireducens]|uniref:Methyl-accepting transducer domain-containing protein n=1 Tax=Orenia metallireducens TaxID=1413210 RepID=A0A1C0A5Z3_9FIRM|nr:methyl-accepting chemotaxis protein [Orenia metallireducens]OCL25533.1 hypothetical protein U472_14435 [Orenia metallireducens]